MLVPSLLLLAILILIALGWVTWRFKTIWHPLLIPFGSLFVMVALAPLAQQLVLGERIYPLHQAQAALLTCLYVVAFSIPFLINLDPVTPLIERALRPLEIPSRPELRGGYQFASLFLFASGCLTFLLLIANSPRGWDWIFNSRVAYQAGRAGVGHWYVLSQGCFLLAYLSWLWFCRVRNWFLFIPATLFMAGLFWFFGSKQGILGVLITAGLYSSFFIRPMSPRLILLAGACLVPLVILSPWLQGNFRSLRETLGYYDYFDNSARYLQQHHRIGYQYGGAFVTSFWEYVPRGLYSGKPFIYGQLIVNDKLWPGVTEQGHTPALLPWVVFHLDFGTRGVFVGGLVSGFLLRGIYGCFLRTRSFPAFLLLLQYCFIPVLKHTPLFFFLAALTAICLTFRLADLVWTILWSRLAEKKQEAAVGAASC